MPNQVKRLTKSHKDEWVFGVCGGIAEYYNIDPNLVRLIALVLILSGPGLVIYFILGMIMPEGEKNSKINKEDGSAIDLSSEQIKKNVEGMSDNISRRVGRSDTWAWVLIGLGLFFLLQQILPWDWFSWRIFWPLILVAVGLAFLIKKK